MNDIIIIESIWQVLGFLVSILAVFSLLFSGLDSILLKLTLSEIKRVNKVIFDLKIENWKVKTV